MADILKLTNLNIKIHRYFIQNNLSKIIQLFQFYVIVSNKTDVMLKLIIFEEFSPFFDLLLTHLLIYPEILLFGSADFQFLLSGTRKSCL